MLTFQVKKKFPFTPSEQHYLRAIYELQEEQGYARVTDVARKLNIGKGAVSLALKGLVARDLIRHPHYQVIELLPQGEVAAKQVMSRFSILKHFLGQVLGVKKNMASVDACMMEHFISGETLDRLIDLIRFFELDDELIQEAVQRFQAYRRTCESMENCRICEFNCEVTLPEVEVQARGQLLAAGLSRRKK